MPERGNDHDVGIARIDPDCADVPRRLEADAGPALAAVRRLVEAAAGADVVPRLRLSRANIDRVRIRARDCQRANRRWQLIPHRGPGAASVHGLPHAPARSAEVESIWPSRDARRHRRPTATKGAEQPPVQLRVRTFGEHRLRLHAGTADKQQQSDESARTPARASDDHKVFGPSYGRLARSAAKPGRLRSAFAPANIDSRYRQ